MADRHDASGYLIRHPELGDVEACAALHARVWQHAYRGLMSEDAYAQLGARGSSVFFCSGDNGVYSFPFNSNCDNTEFGPTFPSGCPL